MYINKFVRKTERSAKISLSPRKEAKRIAEYLCDVTQYSFVEMALLRHSLSINIKYDTHSSTYRYMDEAETRMQDAVMSDESRRNRKTLSLENKSALSPGKKKEKR